jgi:hypothetical protein
LYVAWPRYAALGVWPKDVYNIEACTGGLIYRGVSPGDMLDLYDLGCEHGLGV